MLPGLLSESSPYFVFLLFFFLRQPFSRQNRALVTAMGGNSYFWKLAFPLGILRLCFTFLIAEASLFLIDAFFPGAVPLYIWASLPWYLPALAGMEAFFAAVFPSSGVSLLPVLFAASLILCPIFLDITVFLPLLEPLRWILPPCWLYIPSETPGLPAWLWPLLSLLCLAAGYSALLLRCKFSVPGRPYVRSSAILGNEFLPITLLLILTRKGDSFRQKMQRKPHLPFLREVHRQYET